MAAKKKSVASETATAVSNVIAVDAHKLSQGLKMTFEGMAMVFDSIGVEAGLPAVKAATSETEAPVKEEIKTADAEVAVAEEEAEAKVEAEEQPKAQSAAVDEKPSATEPTDAPEASDSTVEEPAKESTEPTSTISIDDITKIIVQKIKQNRGNNEKIGSILKAYGASKVGELPVSKYEAFLTDLSAI